ncbi:class I SAM-dependent methyltransferase [Extensimonas sp. H3M7-6]|jgi:SAM-dependent methyltransferase|uniref:class I SAM-dependent methyltransferase n=1 Tax=Extensimonas soli TaxID=3031322 RepID=UPI00387EC9DF
MTRDPLWEEIFTERAWGRYPSEDLVRFGAQRLGHRQPRSDVRVLEVGFGTGANLWYFAREGYSVAGLEGTEAGCRRARSRLDLEVPGWNRVVSEECLRVGDMCEPMPWATDTFDAVVDCNAVMCVDHASACEVYAEMHRVCRPGGWLYARTPASGTWGEGTGEACGHHAWRCSEGPFSGTGIARFATESDLPLLFASWELVSVEQASRTLEGRQKIHIEWVVIGRKAST